MHPLIVVAAATLLANAFIGSAADFARYGLKGERAWYQMQEVVAERLHQMGLRAGDNVVYLGNGYEAYWARLAKVHIVAESPLAEDNEASTFDGVLRADTLNKFRSLGAKAIVAVKAWPRKDPANWERLAGTDYWVYRMFP